MIEGNIAAIRAAAVFADVLTRGRVIAVKEIEPDAMLEPGDLFRDRWAALLRDSSGEVPIFGFGKPPPIDAWIVVRGDLGGFTDEALANPTFVAQTVAERGWADSVEMCVDYWRVLETAPEQRED